ncbi:kinetochore protein SLK19-like isoform X1 [Cimex lectularius]|uniref:Uncharacterized protein n=1 Tax=Cimex lectularius TaxID=79782 RepID=A0A8I6SFG4_CIMLE|nr:kinetochore protein SLK19-like isoform X1 [Cimex lectularius]
MALNPDLEQLDNELELVFFACPCNPDGQVKIQDLIDQLASKYGSDIIGCLQEELSSTDSNDTNQFVSREDFIKFMKNIIILNSGDNVQSTVSFVNSEYVEFRTPLKYSQRTFVEEVDNNNFDCFHQLNISNASYCSDDIRYLRDSKEALEQKLIKAENSIQFLEEHVKIKTDKNIKLSKEIEIMKEDINKIQSLEEECFDLKDKLNKLEVKHKHATSSLKKANLKIEILEEDKFSQSAEIRQLSEELSKKAIILKQMENYNKSLYDEVNILKEKNETLSKKIKEMSVELIDKEVLMDRITELASEKQNLQIQLSEITVSQALNNISNMSESDTSETRIVCMTPFPVENPGVSLKSELNDAFGLDSSQNGQFPFFANQTIECSVASTQTESREVDICMFETPISCESSHTDLGSRPIIIQEKNRLADFSTSSTEEKHGSRAENSEENISDLGMMPLICETPVSKVKTKSVCRSLYKNAISNFEELAAPLENGLCDMDICQSPISIEGRFTGTQTARMLSPIDDINKSTDCIQLDMSETLSSFDSQDSISGTINYETPTFNYLEILEKEAEMNFTKVIQLKDEVVQKYGSQLFKENSSDKIVSNYLKRKNDLGIAIINNGLKLSTERDCLDTLKLMRSNKNSQYKLTYFSFPESRVHSSSIYGLIWLIHALTKLVGKMAKLCVITTLLFAMLAYSSLVMLCVNGSPSLQNPEFYQCFVAPRLPISKFYNYASGLLTFQVTYPHGPPPT